MTAKTMAEVLAEHRYDHGHRSLHQHCTCGWFGKVLGDGFPAHQAAALSAAGFGLVSDAKAEALTEAAERFKQRSDTHFNIMKKMAGLPDFTAEDITRYGAYSAEANTAATWLRTQAAKTRAVS